MLAKTALQSKRMTLILKILTTAAQAAQRLDKALASSPDCALSRARLQQLIKAGNITCNERPVLDPAHKVSEGETYTIILPPPEQAQPEAQKIPLQIIYEDDDLLVIDKPAGLVVHPAAGNRDHTLVNALLAHCGKSLSGIGGVARPGIVHRLDKDTSGLMVVAKNDTTHQALSRQFTDRSLSRIYTALVWGLPTPAKGDIEGAIGRHPRARQKMAVVTRGGKPALTHYAVREGFANIASLVECKLATGRTHQIRVHMAHIKHPVIGDPTYGRKRTTEGQKGNGPVAKLMAFHRQALHATEIHFIHPRTGKAMRFKTPLPEDLSGLLKALRKSKL